MTLRLSTYNCRGIKSSIDSVKTLCDSHDIILLQEHWLTKAELTLLSNLHPDFHACGISAMDDSSGIRVGRPYGGVAIMWRKSLGQNVTIKYLNDTRLIGAEIITSLTKLFIICVYLPTCSKDNYDSYMAYLANINNIVNEVKTSNVIVLGDFNANLGTMFGEELNTFCHENNLHISDIEKLGKSDDHFTYISEAHGSTAWLDHILSTHAVHTAISDVRILHDYLSSDHFPLCVDIEIEGLVRTCPFQHINGSNPDAKPNWSKATSQNILTYAQSTDHLLRNLVIPKEVFACRDSNCKNTDHLRRLQLFYSNIIDCLKQASCNSIPTSKSSESGFNAVPGWNEHVRNFHKAACEAFQLWVVNRRPRSGPLYDLMRKTRAKFKSVLRACKRDESRAKADAMAFNLTQGGTRKFWNSVHSTSGSFSPLPTNVSGCSGHENIANMWKNHYENLLNSVPKCHDKDIVLSSLERIDFHEGMVVTVNEIREFK